MITFLAILGGFWAALFIGTTALAKASDGREEDLLDRAVISVDFEPVPLHQLTTPFERAVSM